MHISLDPDAEAFVQQKIALGETPDAVINKALAYLQNAEKQHKDWLKAELFRGEESGEPIPYTAGLLDEIEQEVLMKLATDKGD